MANKSRVNILSVGHDTTNFEIPEAVFEAMLTIVRHVEVDHPELFPDREDKKPWPILVVWDPDVKLLNQRRYGIPGIKSRQDHSVSMDIVCDGRLCPCVIEFPKELPPEVSNGALEGALVYGRRHLERVRRFITEDMLVDGLTYQTVSNDRALLEEEAEELEDDLDTEEPGNVSSVSASKTFSVKVLHVGETNLVGCGKDLMSAFLSSRWRRAHSESSVPEAYEWECSWEHIADEEGEEIDERPATIQKVVVDTYRLTFVVEDDCGTHECTVLLGGEVFIGSGVIASELAALLPGASVTNKTAREVVRASVLEEILKSTEGRVELVEQLKQKADFEGTLPRAAIAEVLQQVITDGSSRIPRAELGEMIEVLVNAQIIGARYGESIFELLVVA